MISILVAVPAVCSPLQRAIAQRFCALALRVIAGNQTIGPEPGGDRIRLRVSADVNDPEAILCAFRQPEAMCRARVRDPLGRPPGVCPSIEWEPGPAKVVGVLPAVSAVWQYSRAASAAVAP
jgi:hypothetical protein